MTQFTGKVCIITGAASGIGKALVLRLAEQGAKLCISDIDENGLAQTEQDIVEFSNGLLDTAALDISDDIAVTRYIKRIHTQFGVSDYLFNVAGIAIWGLPSDLAIEHYKSVMDVNLMGTIYMTDAVVKGMVWSSKGGHIVNVSSAAGLLGLPIHAAYSASKFGVVGFSESLRFDLEPKNIKVSVVCPGGVNTGLVHTVRIANVDTNKPAAEKLRSYFSRHAITPEQAADKILNGVKKNTFLIYTSKDIQLMHFLKNKAPDVFVLSMRMAAKFLHKQVKNLKKD